MGPGAYMGHNCQLYINYCGRLPMLVIFDTNIHNRRSDIYMVHIVFMHLDVGIVVNLALCVRHKAILTYVFTLF